MNNSSNNKKSLTGTNQLVGPSQYQDNINYLHKEKNRLSKYNTEEKDNRLDLKYLKPELKSKIKDELERNQREQLILLKENKQNIIDFIIENKDSIRIEDLKIYEPIYKYYRQKENCQICNTLSNIVCKNCDISHNNNKEVWLCTNHWQEHAIEKH
ncbi:MAG TPA: hypothetical protein VFK40_15170 [Nitrososphaeraceae archaeon]|nr:hypothetical protein [Nitrososphaeraceae archaeon]